jgi:hypothetical protein
MLHLYYSARMKCACAAIFLMAALIALSGCSPGKDASHIGTFRMGEKVQAGPLIYTVLEAEWKTHMEGSGRAPANRFLFMRVSITNSGGTKVSAPAFTLRASNGKTYEEVTEGLEGVSNWLNILRTIEPAQTQNGWVIFDAPVAGYKLVMSDAGDIGSEKYAYVDIPVELEPATTN